MALGLLVTRKVSRPRLDIVILPCAPRDLVDDAPADLVHGLLPRVDVDFDVLADHLKPLGNATRLRLLHMLTRPLYLEEIASKLGMSRQGARKHLDDLVDLGVLRKQFGRRDFGPVTEYVTNAQKIFLLQVEFEKLGGLKPPAEAEPRPTLDRSASATGARRSPPRPAPRLAIVRGPSEGCAFELADQAARVWRIGRDKAAEIRLDHDPFLSNRHAEVRRDARGFVLADAFSRNGTTLNWRRLDRGATVALKPGDVIGVGKTSLVFQVP